MAVADGHIIYPTKKAILPPSNKLTEKARVAFSFNNLKSSSLILIGKLCDENCIAIFSKYDVQIIRHSEILINGKRTDNGLWKIPLSKNQPTLGLNPPETTEKKQVANGIIKVDTEKSEMADYYATTLFNPTKST